MKHELGNAFYQSKRKMQSKSIDGRHFTVSEFDNCVLKIKRGVENSMTDSEREAFASFLLPNTPDRDERSSSDSRSV